MKQNKFVIGALAALLSLGAVQAQAQQPQKSITLSDAIGIALKQNPQVLLAQNSADMSATNVSQSKAAFLPDLRLSTSTSNSVGRNFSQSEGGIVNQATQSLNAGVSSSVTLFDGFRNLANLKEAQLSQNASAMDVDRAKQTAAFNVASEFLSIAESAEQIKVQQEALASQQAQEKQIQLLVDAGARPIADLYQQQAAVASTQAALVNAQRTWQQAKLDLVQILQLDPAGDYDFVTPQVNTSSADSFDVGGLIAKALQQRKDLNAGAVRVEAAQQNVKAANAVKWPTVSLSAGYNTGASSASDLTFGDQLDQRRGGSLSLSVSLPVFDRLNGKTAQQQADIQVNNAAIQLASQKQDVAVQVRKTVLDYQSAQEQLKAAQAQEKAAALALDATQKRYNIGAATLVEVTQARATQVQAASSVVNARYTLALQRTVMKYYTGELDPQTLTLS